jgi:hypothetical protein
MAKLTGNVVMADGESYAVKVLLSDGDSNAKLAKSNKAGKGYLTYGLSLAPASTSGYNVCSKATAGCSTGCLFYAGQGRFANVQRGRIAKARLLFQDKATFRAMLFAELHKARAKAHKQGLTLAVRLNVLSDIPWERVFPELFTEFSDVQFYDYTKLLTRVDVPTNYHLTYSRSETNEAGVIELLSAGRNVAVVFDDKALPATWQGFEVINGDETDLRFLDKAGVVVGLYAKGRAKANDTGFVVPTMSANIIALRPVA